MAFFDKLIGRKGAADDDLSDDDMASDFDDHDEDGEGNFWSRMDSAKRRKVMLFGGGAAGLLVIGIVALLLFSGGDHRSGTMISVELPDRTVGGGLTPPGEGADPDDEAAADDDDDASLNDVADSVEDGNAATAGVVVSSTPLTAFDGVPAPPQEMPLPAAPIADITEQNPLGPLPMVSEDGLEPWRLYARDFTFDDRPRIVLIVGGLGLSRAATMAAIERLPGDVALAFSPYGENLSEYAALAREYGHEPLAAVPMEPDDFPQRDPGPMGLMTTLPDDENLRRLDRALAALPGHVGVLASMGSRFATEEAAITPVLEHLKKRGVMWVDNRPGGGTRALDAALDLKVPTAFIDMVIDDDPSPAAIARNLARLEETARRRSVAVALARPLPVTLESLGRWIADLDARTITLAPVTAVAGIQIP